MSSLELFSQPVNSSQSQTIQSQSSEHTQRHVATGTSIQLTTSTVNHNPSQNQHQVCIIIMCMKRSFINYILSARYSYLIFHGALNELLEKLSRAISMLMCVYAQNMWLYTNSLFCFGSLRKQL